MEIKNISQLRSAIALYEVDVEVKRKILVDQYHAAIESLRPANIVKGAINKIIETPDIVDKVVGTAAGFGAGILTKKLLIGKSDNIFKKLFGTVIEIAVAGTVSKNATTIKEKGIELFNKLTKKDQDY